MLPSYITPCHKVAHFLFLNFSQLVKFSSLATSENWITFPVIFDILYLDHRTSLPSVLDVLLGSSVVFLPFSSVLWYINMVHYQHTYLKRHVFVILLFFVSCPEPPVCISGVGSFPVLSGGSLIILQYLKV